MNSDRSHIHAVPTNVITGFLGVGKTSAILHLLNQKPSHERWAILVNEFGEIGVDGSLLEGQSSSQEGIFIREVPGGCMCCASGLPMQIALNQLLARARPDRLIIEPTGLGHPKEVLQVLSSEYYKDILSLQKTLTLVDARKLSDPRYINHETYNQQIKVADTIVGNKLDLYEDEDIAILNAFVKKQGQPHANLLLTQYGEIPFSALEGSIAHQPPIHGHIHHHEAHASPLDIDTPIPDCGFLKAVNKGEGFNSIGWRFSPDKIFNRQKLFLFLTGLSAERMKAVFITEEGVFGYNLTPDALTEVALDDCQESCIEIIAETVEDSLQPQLLACL